LRNETTRRGPPAAGPLDFDRVFVIESLIISGSLIGPLMGPPIGALDPQPRRRNTGSTLRSEPLDRFDPYRGALAIVWRKQVDSQSREQRFHRSRQSRRQPDPFAACMRRTWVRGAGTCDFRLLQVFHPNSSARPPAPKTILCKADTKPA
jgi:hypothetical protein